MDESGITLHLIKGPFIVGRLRHDFITTPEGTLYQSRLVIGVTTPIIRRIVNKFIRKKKFDLDKCEAWLKHNIEEVGNFQFFLPELYIEKISGRTR